MLHALKYKLDRSTLEKVYFAFIRPIFEYACVVCDSAPRYDYIFNNIKKLQISAARIVIGTNTYSSNQLLYHDTGWELLSSEQRLILFDKIINGLSPPHLSKLYNTHLSNNTRYGFRYPNIQNAFARTETYRCSFFPSAIRTWNSLGPSVKDSSTFNEF